MSEGCFVSCVVESIGENGWWRSQWGIQKQRNEPKERAIDEQRTAPSRQTLNSTLRGKIANTEILQLELETVLLFQTIHYSSRLANLEKKNRKHMYAKAELRAEASLLLPQPTTTNTHQIKQWH